MRWSEMPTTGDGLSPAPASTGRARAQGLRAVLATPYLLIALTVLPVVLDGRLTVVGPFIGAMGLLGLGLTVMAARRTPGRASRPWWLLSLSWAVLAVTSAGFNASGFTTGTGDSRPASAVFVVAMLARLAFGAVLFAGLVSFSQHLHGRAGWRLTADAVTVTGAGLMIMWYFLLGPALSGQQMIGMARIYTIVLPISDLTLVLGTVVVLLSGSGLTNRRALILLLGGVTTYLLLDSLLVAEVLQESQFGISPRLTLMLMAAPPFLFAAAAAEHCRTVAEPDSSVQVDRMRAVPYLPQGCLVVGYAMLAVIAMLNGLYPWPGLIAGAIIMTLGVAVRQSIAVQENRELAHIDALTRLPNRANFTQAVNDALDRAHRNDVLAAVLLIDLNDFKPVNDRYGHEAGDEVLVAFAAILRRSLRDTDHCARLGGDEFAVVLRDVRDADEACDTARLILAALADTPVLVRGHEFALSASIGVAVTDRTRPAVDSATLVRRADEAMYVAKRARTTGWHLWTAGTAHPSATESAVSAPSVLYQSVQDLTGKVVAVRAVPPAPLTGSRMPPSI